MAELPSWFTSLSTAVGNEFLRAISPAAGHLKDFNDLFKLVGVDLLKEGGKALAPGLKTAGKVIDQINNWGNNIPKFMTNDLKRLGVKKEGLDWINYRLTTLIPPVMPFNILWNLWLSFKYAGMSMDAGFEVFAEAMRQELNIASPLLLPTPAEVLKLWWRGHDQEKLKQWHLRQGYSDEVWRMIDAANQPILGPAELIGMKHRRNLSYLDGISPESVDEFLKHAWEHLGYHESQLPGVKMNAWVLPPVTYLLELARRFPDWKRNFKSYAQGLGFPEPVCDALELLTDVMPTPTDLVRFGVREVFTPEIAQKFRQYEDFPEDIMAWGDRIGMTRELMELYWAAHWDLPSPGQGFDMYHRKIIDYDELGGLLRALDVMPFWRDRLIQISHRLIPRRTIARLARARSIEMPKAIDLFMQLGYTAENSALMVAADYLDEQEPVKNLAKGEILTAYRRQVVTEAWARQQLQALGYVGENITFYLRWTEFLRTLDEKTRNAPQSRTQADEARELTKAEILRAYSSGLLTQAEAERHLTDLDYEPTEITLLIKLEDWKRTQAHRTALTNEIEKRYKAGIYDATIARSKVADTGYTADQAAKIVAVWVEEATTASLLAEIPDKEPTKAELRKWLKIGVIDVDTWVAEMHGLGYSERLIGYYLGELILTEGT